MCKCLNCGKYYVSYMICMEDLDKGDDNFWLSFFWVNVHCTCAWHKWSFHSSILRALRSPHLYVGHSPGAMRPPYT